MRKNYSMTGLLAVSVFVLSMGASSLALAEGAGQYIDDATITTKVKAALLDDSQLKATQVSVETDQGVVQLSGTVDTKTQESEAVNAANRVSGVKSVKDLMTVKTMQEE
jgi:osmotically-inducible protein OsmY